MRTFRRLIVWLGTLSVATLTLVRAELKIEVAVVAPSERVRYAVTRLEAGAREPALARSGWSEVVIGRATDPAVRALLDSGAVTLPEGGLPAEGFLLAGLGDGRLAVIGADDSGVLYGSLELARRLRAGELDTAGSAAAGFRFVDAPVLRLRGACIGMQKPYILPGRHVYEYPYTPEEFPFFYDQAQWIEYLDFLVEQRMNTLYLWNGHPFASLVKLPDYPYALEVSEEVFAKNVEMFRFLTAEADRRGIWVVQMFYNIILSKPFAERHGLPTQLNRTDPIAGDYTRKSIAEFVRQYPNVGLLICLGEALQDVPMQRDWFTQVILPGVKDGMAQAGLTAEPPVVIRAHATDPKIIMPAALEVYRNLYTMAKFNGESLTTWEPRGVWQEIHQSMGRLGTNHVVNVHILANLEPFRYGAPRFIRQSVLATRDRLGGSGLHLYPLTYWNWPDAPDLVAEGEAPLRQIDRDWIWFEAWARYAWQPDVEPAADHAYWVARLSERFGTTAMAAEQILAAYNDSGECAPRLLRRFGITEGNRQTMALGMTLDQLVDPAKYRPYAELWKSQAPPGERLQEFVERELAGQPHEGETPVSIVREVREFAASAVAAIEAAAPHVTQRRAEFARLRNDMHAIQAMTENFAAKVEAAEQVLRHRATGDPAELAAAEERLAASLEHFRTLTRLTEGTYHFANSMQTSQRRIPVPGGVDGKPANYHWRELLPVYEQELVDFRAHLTAVRAGEVATERRKIGPLRAVPFQLVAPAAGAKATAESYTVQTGSRVFTDRPWELQVIAAELAGLTGIRFSHTEAAAGRYAPVEFEVAEPVRVLVGYVQSTDAAWLQEPRLETDALAGERGGAEALVENAATVDTLPKIAVHELRFPAGRHRLELRGRGSFVVLGVVAAPPKP